MAFVNPIGHQTGAIRPLRLIAVGLLLASALAACNTIAGAGEDTSNAGKAIENSADRNK